MQQTTATNIKSIVLVDDDLDVLDSLKRDLRPWYERRGLEVHAVDSGAACLRVVSREYPSVGIVISDLRMPGMSGSELFVKLSDFYPDVGCIMVTAHSDIDQISRAISGNMLGLIQKPWDTEKLSGELDKALDFVQTRRQADQRNRTLTNELELAGAFQRACMRYAAPDDSRIGLDLLSRPTPGLEVTGDFYKFFSLDADRYLMVLGDVAGHGIRSALLSGMVTTMARNYVASTDASEFRPSDFLKSLNEGLFEFVPQDSNLLVACVAVVVDLKARRAYIANAGQPPVFLLRKGTYIAGTVVDVALGAQPRLAYRYEELALEPGDRVVLFTDGLYENRRARETAFSHERMGKLFSSADGEPNFGEVVVKRSTEDRILRGVPTVPLFEDDVTIASVKIRE